MKRFLPLGALALSLGFTMQATIVQDGGFESPTTGIYTAVASLGDGWTATTGTIGIENNTFEGAVPHSGNQFAYLDEFSTVNTLSQTLTTTAGQSYTISYWVADNSPDMYQVTFGGQTLFNGAGPTAGVGSAADYVNETFTAVASGPSTVLSFSGKFGGGDGAFGTILDDVDVTGSPEPGTIALFGLGCVVIAALKRKRS